MTMCGTAGSIRPSITCASVQPWTAIRRRCSARRPISGATPMSRPPASVRWCIFSSSDSRRTGASIRCRLPAKARSDRASPSVQLQQLGAVKYVRRPPHGKSGRAPQPSWPRFGLVTWATARRYREPPNPPPPPPPFSPPRLPPPVRKSGGRVPPLAQPARATAGTASAAKVRSVKSRRRSNMGRSIHAPLRTGGDGHSGCGDWTHPAQPVPAQGYVRVSPS
jgi:hypothetical protein